MKKMKIGMGLALLVAGGTGAVSYSVLADGDAGYKEMVALPEGLKARELKVQEGQVVAVLAKQGEAEAIVSYDPTGRELWRKELVGSHHALGDDGFALISGNRATVHSFEDGKETASFSLPEEFRMSGSGAEVKIESGHLLVTGNLGGRLFVHRLDGTAVASIEGASLRQADVVAGHLVYFDGNVLHGRLLSGGKDWRSPGVMEPYVVHGGTVYYIKGPTEEVDTPVLIARSLEKRQVEYEKALPVEEELALVGADSEGPILELGLSGEWVFYGRDGEERLRKPLRSASFRALETRYRPVVSTYALGYEEDRENRLLALRQEGTSALGNSFGLGEVQVIGPEGGFEKVLEHAVDAAALSPSGGAAVLGGGKLVFYDAAGNRVAQESVPDGSAGLEVLDESFYIFGGSGIASFSGEPEPKKPVVTSLKGRDGYETAALLSKQVWDSAETVVLATGEDFADALAGAPLAYQEGGPLLFTVNDRLNEAAKAEIQRLGANKALVIGSRPVISDEQLEELAEMGVETERIGGKTRFETAALVAGYIESDGAVVADGSTFKDVSKASVYAAQNGYPILLSRGSRLPKETREAMAGRSDIVLAGDRLSFASRVKDQEAGRRLAVLAPASSFTDALAGANAAARENASLYLIDEGGLTEDLKEQLSGYESFLLVDSKEAFDGEWAKELEALVE